MPKIRDMLVHVQVETAERRRKCHRNPKKHSIAKGEDCLVISDGPYNASKNYCKICAAEILSHAEKKINEIVKRLK